MTDIPHTDANHPKYTEGTDTPGPRPTQVAVDAAHQAQHDAATHDERLMQLGVVEPLDEPASTETENERLARLAEHAGEPPPATAASHPFRVMGVDQHGEGRPVWCTTHKRDRFTADEAEAVAKAHTERWAHHGGTAAEMSYHVEHDATPDGLDRALAAAHTLVAELPITPMPNWETLPTTVQQLRDLARGIGAAYAQVRDAVEAALDERRDADAVEREVAPALAEHRAALQTAATLDALDAAGTALHADDRLLPLFDLRQPSIDRILRPLASLATARHDRLRTEQAERDAAQASAQASTQGGTEPPAKLETGG